MISISQILRYSFGIAYSLWIFTVLAMTQIAFIFYYPLVWFHIPLLRKITDNTGRRLWFWLVYLFTSTGGMKIIVYGDELPDNEKAFVMSNHQHWCDWVTIMCLAQWKQALGGLKGFAKESLSYVPFAGAALKVMGYVFLSRNWENDKKKLRQAFYYLKEGKSKYWLFTHPEGARISEDKLRSSHELAEEKNLPKLRNVLLPKPNGFVMTIDSLRDELDAVYDFTFAYEKHPVNIIEVIGGAAVPEEKKSNVIHVLCRRYDAKSIPTERSEQIKWLNNLYQEKDKILGNWKINKKFEGTGKKISFDITIEQCWRSFGMWVVETYSPIVIISAIAYTFWKIIL
eukprot:TRINITY_DN5655_c0_g1_i1.p1 TRINITY_DN5655_c0_g1~~TRINITY_DN5655_c0_g1_i1.p1  ORF type:complete len:342 (+),score=50.32 TRINITY_DN5655_c0_g1_i1:104-1129(+)